MDNFLENGYLSNAGRTSAEMKDALELLLGACKTLPGAMGAQSVTIASDAIAATGPLMVVDTQGGAAADDLRSIATTGMRNGYLVWLWGASAARTVTLKHTPATLGGLSLAGGREYVLGPDKPILLALTGTVWKEVMSTTVPSGAAVQALTVQSGAITAPGPLGVIALAPETGSSDFLDLINYGNLPNGSMLLLNGPDSGYVDVRPVQTGQGSVVTLDGAFVRLYKQNAMLLVLNAGRWYEKFRTELSVSRGKAIYGEAGTYTFAVPTRVTGVWVSMIGGGGGGGGGSDPGNNGQAAAAGGTSGSAGGESSFGTYASCAGGAAGEAVQGAAFVQSLINAQGAVLLGGNGGAPYGEDGEHSFGSTLGRGGKPCATPFGAYGRGGRGGNGAIYQANNWVQQTYGVKRGGSGGGAGSCSAAPVIKQWVGSLTPGQAIPIVVGAGGDGGAGGLFSGGSYTGQAEAGETGSAGIVIVEW